MNHNSPPNHLHTYIAVLTAFAGTSVLCWIYWYGVPLGVEYVIGALLLGLLIAVTYLMGVNLSPVDLGDKQYGGSHKFVMVELSELITMVVLGPIWAAAAALPSTLATLGRDEPLRHVYEGSSTTARIFLAAIPFHLVAQPLLLNPTQPPIVVVVATAAAGLVFVSFSVLSGGVIFRIKYDRPLPVHIRNFLPYLPLDLVNVAVVALSIAMFAIYPPVAVILLMGGLFASFFTARRLHLLISDNHRYKDELQSLKTATLQSNMAFALQLIVQLGHHDGFAHRHAAATGTYAADIMDELGYTPERVEAVRMAGLLHNIGLLDYSHTITSWEDEKAPDHPLLGEQRLAAAPGMTEIASWVAAHHERPNRCGYPQGLPGEWIPLEAKVLSVADSYARMILDKPHQPGEPPDAAIARLRKGIGSQFDRKPTKALIRLIETSPSAYTHALTDAFRLPGIWSTQYQQQSPDQSRSSTQPSTSQNPSATTNDPLNL